MRPLQSLGWLLGAIVALSSCAGEPGVGWGPIDLVLDVQWQVPEDRRARDGEILTASGWQIALDEVIFEAAATSLLTTVASRAGTATGFDPSQPPPGYSLCHGGHCHADDGRLVSYEEIAGELAAGAGDTQKVLARFGPLRADALAPTGDHVACAASCLLAEETPTRLVLEATSLRIAGHVRDRRDVPRLAGDRAFVVEVPLGNLRLAAPLAWPSRPEDEAPTWRLRAALPLGPALLDAIDWSTAVGDPLQPTAKDLEAVAKSLASTVVEAEVSRD